MIRRLLLIGLACVSTGGVVADSAEPPAGLPDGPLRVRNVTPVAHLYGLPRPLGAVASGTAELSLTLEHSNNFTARSDDGLTVVLDGSTTVTSLALRSGLGERWEWGVSVPMVHHGGGFTDGFIEGFHDLFGFPDANREAVARDRLDYRIVENGSEVLTISEAQAHLGDVGAWLGYRVHDGHGRRLVVRGMLEAPTGRVEDLSGSEATDVSLWLELLDDRWLEALNTRVTAMAGVTRPGKGKLLSERQEDLVASAHLGLHYPLSARVTLRAQLDGHSDVIDTGVEPLGGGALLGTLGGSIALSPSWRLDLAVVEDLTPHAAPDVVLLIMLGARL